MLEVALPDSLRGPAMVGILSGLAAHQALFLLDQIESIAWRSICGNVVAGLTVLSIGTRFADCFPELRGHRLFFVAGISALFAGGLGYVIGWFLDLFFGIEHK